MILRRRSQGGGLQRADTTLMRIISRTITMLTFRRLRLIRHPIHTINKTGTNRKTNSSIRVTVTTRLFLSLFNNKIIIICLMILMAATLLNNTRQILQLNINRKTNNFND